MMNSEKSEAEKLAKMNKEQKLEYQAQKERTDKEKALAELNAYKLKEQATKIASEKGLDISLLTFFNFETVKAEEINSKIEEVSNAFNKAVEKAVNERLKEDTPIQKTGIDNKEDIAIGRLNLNNKDQSLTFIDLNTFLVFALSLLICFLIIKL